MKTLNRWFTVVLAAFLSGSLEANSCMPMPWRGEKPLVQVAILLDTSNSMDGLIEQAKSQLWRLANDLAYSTRCGERPAIEIALYEYGNNGLSAGENYIRQVLPFTTDLDLVAQKLFALRTNGGNEYCGAVIKDAVQNLRWSPRRDVYKALFIAGNEPFTQGPVYFREAVAQAVTKNVRVNTIFCGARADGVQTQWQDGADAGRGAYLTIDHNRAVVVDPTPYDDEITRLGGQLNETYVAYGMEGRRALHNQASADRLASSVAPTAGAVPERALMKAAPQYADASWDVARKVSKGEAKASELRRQDLPAALQAKSDAELETYLKDQNKKREDLQSRLGELKGKRDAYLAQKQAAGGNGSVLSLDEAMRSAIRAQAGGLEFKFEAPVR